MAQALAYTLVSGLMTGLVAWPVVGLLTGLLFGLVSGAQVAGNGAMWFRYLSSEPRWPHDGASRRTDSRPFSTEAWPGGMPDLMS